jgi:stage III sporulation protein AG
MEKWKQKIRNMKKEDYIVLLLIGVLLLIISLPADKEKKGGNSAGVLQEKNGQEGGNAVEPGESTEKTSSGGTQGLVIETGNFNNNNSYSLDSYVDSLEKRMEEIISGMEGVGKVQVMITLSDTGMEILERNREITASDLEETDNAGGNRKNTESGEREEVIYKKDADGNETPYVVQRKLPEVTGVVVIAEGAGNTKVKENIIGAVSVLFNLNEHRIKVIRMKS